MADTLKKYLDQAGLEALVGKIKSEDDAHLQEAKDYAAGLAPNYDAAGAAKTAKEEAIADADAKFATVNEELAKKALATDLQAEATRATQEEARLAGLIDGVSTKANANETAIAAINNAETGILKQAKDYTDTEVAKVQGEVDQLNTKVGELPEGTTATSVVDYVNKKTEGIATDAALGELNSQVAGLQTAVQDIQKDYLVEADKTELQGNIDELAQTHTTDKTALEASIKVITDDYLKAADKAELQGNIDAVSGAVERLTNGVSADEVDGVNDLIQYVNDHGSEVTGMQEDIAKNAEDIAAEKERAEGVEAGFETRIKANEDALATVDTRIATAKTEALSGAEAKAKELDAALKTELEAYADSKVEGVDLSGIAANAGEIATLKGQMTQAQTDIDAVEAQAEENRQAIAGHATRLTDVEAKASTNETNIGTLQTDMATAKGDITTLKTAVNETLPASIAEAKKAGTDAQGTADSALAAANKAQGEVDDLEVLVGAIPTTATATTVVGYVDEKATALQSQVSENASAIAKFTAIPTTDIDALFAK